MSTEVNTTRKTHPGIGLEEMKEGCQDPCWGIMEGFLEEELSTGRSGNQEATGLPTSMCGYRVSKAGNVERQCTEWGIHQDCLHPE